MKLPFLALLRGAVPVVTAAVAAALTGCSSMPVTSSSSREASRSSGMARPAAVLGTAWGETRDSRVTATAFERAHSRPDGVGELHYNDATQFETISPVRMFFQPGHGKSFIGLHEFAGGKVAMGLKDGWGHWIPGIERDGRAFIVGQERWHYDIVVRNLTRQRLEVVVSVDGLDVLDGRSASFSKRGYLIPARGTVTIPGWRTSTSSVAAFRFAAAEDSYAAKKHGDTRNVGVIGVAVFTEKEPPLRVFAEPPPSEREPNPFPGERWARPPRG